MEKKHKAARILVTGGAGYIGSHIVVELLALSQTSGLDIDSVVIFDNFSNASKDTIIRIKQLLSVTQASKLRVVEGDLRVMQDVKRAFRDPIDIVIHCGGCKSIAESLAKPLHYYQNNVLGTINLLQVMKESECHKLIFSSSTTVYGNSHESSFKEDSSKQPLSPYGSSKLMVETILDEMCKNEKEKAWHCISLRYFNPVGAHASGFLGEDATGKDVPQQLFPAIGNVIASPNPSACLQIFGSDLKTRDGTPARDYIHIMDLVDVHVASVKQLLNSTIERNHVCWNVGSGLVTTVLQVVQAFELHLCQKIPYQLLPRRKGDSEVSCADLSKIKHELSWVPKRTLAQAVADTCRWWQNLHKNSDAAKRQHEEEDKKRK